MTCPCRGDGVEGKGVRLTLSGTDQKHQVWKQTLERVKMTLVYPEISKLKRHGLKQAI